MNKTEFTAALADKMDLSKSKAGDIVDALFDANDGIIANELDAGGKVTIPGFGTFSTRERAGRQGTNPATGEKIWIPERTYAKFKPGKTLKERVRE